MTIFLEADTRNQFLVVREEGSDGKHGNSV